MRFFTIIVFLIALVYGEFYEKDEYIKYQKGIIELFNHVIMQNNFPEQIDIAKNFKFDAKQYTNEDVLNEFLIVKRKGFLPKYRLFSLTFEKVRNEAKVLFRLLYFSKDLKVFYDTACWSREYTNEGIFVYAFTLALIHRNDCRKFYIPAIYEIYPFYFVTDDVLNKCSRIKEQGFVTDRKLAAMYGLYSVDDNYTITSNFATSFETSNQEQKISYFTNDIGLNSFYYYFNAQYPFWNRGQTLRNDASIRGELYYFIHQQIQARYNLERLSNDMNQVKNFYWTKPIEAPFNPLLRYHNGKSFPMRSEKYDMMKNDNVYRLQSVEDHEKRIRDHLHDFFTHLKSSSIEPLASLIHEGENGISSTYENPTVLAKFLLGAGVYPFEEKDYVPSALEMDVTALRDPMFYQLNQRYLHYFYVYKGYLERYSSSYLTFPFVKISSVSVDDVQTFMEDFDFDITTAAYISKAEMEAAKENILCFARQKRLNHKAFSINISVISDFADNSTIRLFIGPKYDNQGRLLRLEQSRTDFVQIDQFNYVLKAGSNLIIRNNTEFYNTYQYKIPTRDLYEKLKSYTTDGKYDFDEFKFKNRMPLWTMMPKGKKGGQVFKMFAIITPYAQTNSYYAFSYRINDDKSYGYPLDRLIDESKFYTPNMYMTDFIIYHNE